jgi:hypothetical protein
MRRLPLLRLGQGLVGDCRFLVDGPSWVGVTKLCRMSPQVRLYDKNQ